MFVSSETANKWSREDKARIIGLNSEEYSKLQGQLEEATFLNLFTEADKRNFVSGDEEKARDLKKSLGI